MALDIFRKIEAPKGLFAVEKATVVYALFTTLVIICSWGEMADPGRLLWGRLQILGATVILMLLYRLYPCKLTTYLRVIIQLSFLIYWYPDTFELNRHLTNQDHIFAGLEQRLFGCQPAVIFSETFPSKWVSEPLNLGYFFYYPMMFIVGTFIFLKKFDWFERWSFVLAASFYTYYTIYLFLPVVGPQFYFPVIGWDNVEAGVFPQVGRYFDYHPALPPGEHGECGFFCSMVELSQQLGERPTAAFPSSHVGISTLLMLISARLSRNLFCFLLPFYLLLCTATVYIQAHYLIDAIAGFFSAFVIYFIITFIYKYYFATPLFGATSLPKSRSASLQKCLAFSEKCRDFSAEAPQLTADGSATKAEADLSKTDNKDQQS